jgi:hypothetical protein
MDRDELSNVYRGPPIDDTYQVLVHLAEGFQRRRLKCEKLTNDERRTPSDGKSSHCLRQGELKKKGGAGVMVFNDTFNNISAISWRSVLLEVETGVLGEIMLQVTNKIYHIKLYY